MSYCAKCGAPLPPGAQFCPRCGTPLAAAPAEPPAPVVPPPTVPPPAPVTPPPAAAPRPVSAPPPVAAAPARGRFPWWLIPLVLLVIGGLAWLLLAGLPFGGRDREPEVARVETETIAEGTTAAPSSPRETGTILDVEGEKPSALEPNIEPATQTTTPPSSAQPIPKPATPKPQPATVPTPRPTTPAPRPPTPALHPTTITQPLLNDEQASATLRDYVTSRNYYSGVDDDCIRVESRGFRNRGFAYEVWSSCERGGASRLLGRWRVDALTREVFRQHDDGRYLRP